VDHFLFKVSLIFSPILQLLHLNPSAALRPSPLFRFSFLPICKFILFMERFDARIVSEPVCNSLDRVSRNFHVNVLGDLGEDVTMIRCTEWDATIAQTLWKERIIYPVLCDGSGAAQQIKPLHCPCKGSLAAAVHGPKRAQGAAASSSSTHS
jgi:hypothetical protein